jgi:hypothetical protein
VNPSSPTGTSGTPRWRGTVQTYGAVLRGGWTGFRGPAPLGPSASGRATPPAARRAWARPRARAGLCDPGARDGPDKYMRRPARGNWTWGRVRSPLAGGGWGDPPGPPGGAGTALRVERRAVGVLFLREPRWRPGSVRGRMPAHGRRTARRNLDAKIRRSGRRARRSHPRLGLDHDEASGEGTGRVSPFGSGLRSPGHP